MAKNRAFRDPDRPECMVLLGLLPPYSLDDVKQAYLEKVKTAHPDKGGNVSDFLTLQGAFEQASQFVNFRASRMAWLATHMERYVAHTVVVDELSERGAVVETEQIDWLQRSFGQDFAQVTEEVVEISVPGETTGDDMVEYLVREHALLNRLRCLNLRGSRVSDAGLKCLRAFTGLQHLDLRNTRVTVPVVTILQWYPKLRWIGVDRKRASALARFKLRWSRPGLRVAVTE